MKRQRAPRNVAPDRITLTQLQNETGSDTVETRKLLKEAGVPFRESDCTYSRKQAVAAVMARKSVPHMVAHRARGKVAGTISNRELAATRKRVFSAEDIAAMEAEYAEWEAEAATKEARSTNSFADNVSQSYSAMTEAKTQSELERVRKLRLENDTREGKLINRASATATARDIATRVRSSLLAIPRNAAPLLAGLTDEIEIAAIIEGQIRHALQSLANPDTYAREVVR